MYPIHRLITRVVLIVAGALPASAQAAAAQTPAVPSRPEPDPIELHDELLGSYHWPITTASAQAQAFFDQGARLMYAYTPGDARRSFAEARRADPGCAMCWWGEAWSMGPYLNGGMAASAAAPAYAAFERARSLSARPGVPPVERALI